MSSEQDRKSAYRWCARVLRVALNATQQPMDDAVLDTVLHTIEAMEDASDVPLTPTPTPVHINGTKTSGQ